MTSTNQPQPILAADDLLKVNLARMEAYYGFVGARSAGIFDLGIAGLKTLSILNGGAVIALFTLLGHFDRLTIAPTQLWAGFVAFTIGVIAALLAYLLGYLAQNKIMHAEATQAESIYWHMTIGRTDIKPDIEGANRSLRLAIVSAVVSLALFTSGAAVSLSAVHLRSEPPASEQARTQAKPLEAATSGGGAKSK